MSTLPAFFRDKQAQKEWADFINEEMNAETLRRVHAGKDVAGFKEAREIISQSFKKLAELFEPKKKRPRTEKAV